MMMNVRNPRLPPGWYPRDPEQIRRFLAATRSLSDTGPGNLSRSNTEAVSAGAVCAAAPHAGWYYSGAIAARALGTLAGGNVPGSNGAPGNPETTGAWQGTVAVIGGHLPGGTVPLFAMEDAADTPLGPLEIDRELRDMLYREVDGKPDNYADNTVEVLLPMVKHFFPAARLLWARFPADMNSFDVGKVLARTAATLGRDIRVLGSTDLTHYGDNYGWSPKGGGRTALDWVKNVNDRRFIEAVEAGDPALVLARAEEEKSACSAGAVLAVMGCAAEAGKRAGNAASGTCIAYGTSADITAADGEGVLWRPGLPDSFVGYGAFCWQGRE